MGHPQASNMGFGFDNWRAAMLEGHESCMFLLVMDGGLPPPPHTMKTGLSRDLKSREVSLL